MIRLKKLLGETKYAFDRKFGEPLPTFKGVMEKHQTVDKETITEASDKTGWKLYKVYDINSKLWREMKYDLRDQFDELVKVGEDYGVFQNAQGTSRILKQIKRLMDKL